jgi:hypothetical protein
MLPKVLHVNGTTVSLLLSPAADHSIRIPRRCELRKRGQNPRGKGGMFLGMIFLRTGGRKHEEVVFGQG